MRILGAHIDRASAGRLVALDADGRVAETRPFATLPELATAAAEVVRGEPFLLGVDVPVVVPAARARTRAVDRVVRRRLGWPIEPGGRGALLADAAASPPWGEPLLAALAAAGLAALAFPERDLRTSGLVEVHPGLVLKALLWQGSRWSGSGPPGADRETLFRAYPVPAYGRAPRGRVAWAERAAALDLVLRALGNLPGYDVRPVRDLLASTASEDDLDVAAATLDAVLIAGTALRYLEAPEACVFVGERDAGYVVLPADGFIRRLALRDARPQRGRLFPRASLRERLDGVADVRPLDLLPVRGRAERLEAVFREMPGYEFDNVDEMVWWKHCRHVSGPAIPTEGLLDLVVDLGRDGGQKPLRLVRSRHRTLSFRFDPPAAWRARVPPRDGRVYPFRILRATYEAGDIPRSV